MSFKIVHYSLQHSVKNERAYSGQVREANKGQVIRATFSFDLSRNNVAIARCDCLLPVLPPPRATNLRVAESF